MHRRQRIVFGNMGGSEEKPPETKEEKKYRFNTLVFEIEANWEFVIELMQKVKSRNLREINTFERDLLNFILENQIEVDNYKDSNAFIESWFKK